MIDIYFKLVYTNATGSQRTYEASQPLSKDAKGKLYYAIGHKLKRYTKATGNETKEFVIPETFTHVVVSDAHTHIERLAFPAWKIVPVRGKNPFFFRNDTIAGVNTFMMHGGDSRAVKPDKVYLRIIAKGNGYQYRRSVK